MCQFEGKFLLCTCTDDLQLEDIDWKLQRRKITKGDSYSRKIIGQINIPEEYKTMSPEEREADQREADRIVDEIIKKADRITKLKEKRKEEFKNTSIHIQFALNNSICFDTPIDFEEDDILTIRINKELFVWTTYTYKNTYWGISDIQISDQDHDEIAIGKVKSN